MGGSGEVDERSAVAALVAFAQDLIRIPSLSGEEGAAVERAVQEMKVLGFEVEIDSLGNALGMLGGGAPRILFDAHIDTVGPNTDWSIDPYGGQIHDGRLSGLGAVDMKGPLAAIIHGTARASREHRLKGTVGVSITTLEETVEGATLASVIEGFRPDAVIIGEPSNLQLMTAQKGRVELLVEAIGRSGHAAFPETGANALLGAAEILVGLCEWTPPADPELGLGVLVPTETRTFPQPGISVIPDRCEIRFDRRTLPGETEESILSELVEYLPLAGKHGTTASVRVTEGTVSTYTGAVISARRYLPA